jgi:purine-cytosine permease-like protein
MATLAGYVILSCVLGGQAIRALNPGRLSINIGIAIVAIINLVLTFCGSRVIHLFGLYAWIPALIGIVVAMGCSGHHLHKQAPTEPATAVGILGLAAVVAGFFLPWSTIASDFTTYFDRHAKK